MRPDREYECVGSESSLRGKGVDPAWFTRGCQACAHYSDPPRVFNISNSLT